MSERAPKFAVVLLLAASLASPWVALQSIAWAGMLVSYSKDNSITVAFSKTFDGQNPCDLCLAATKGQSNENSDHSVLSGSKLEASVPHSEFFLRPPVLSELRQRLTELPELSAFPPPSPPPRLV